MDTLVVRKQEEMPKKIDKADLYLAGAIALLVLAVVLIFIEYII